MTVKIKIRGLRRDHVQIAPSPLTELGMALHILAEPAHHPELREWSARVSSHMDQNLADRLREADFLWRTPLSEIFFTPACAPDHRTQPGITLTDELNLLDALPEKDFLDLLLDFPGAPHSTAPGRRTLAGPHACELALSSGTFSNPYQSAFRQRLIDTPALARTQLREIFQDCAETFFSDIWAQALPQLSADARLKRDLLKQRGLRAMVRSASKAMSLDNRSQVLTIDKITDRYIALKDRGINFVPTILGRPHVLVTHRTQGRISILYPTPADRPGAPSLEQMKLRLTAVAHPMRMRLCGYLAYGPHTTGELAQAHGLTAPEVSRHLAVLRKANLIITHREGRYLHHQLDLPAMSRLGTDFIESVLR
ncbi:DUF5937 family protein [Streptomyces vinaceus]